MANFDAPDHLATIIASIDVPEKEMTEFTVREVVLIESLLTPGLQTSVKVHSFLHSPVKDLDQFKNKTIKLLIERPILKEFNMEDSLFVNQRIYRLANRKLINNNVEEFVLHACDDTLLNDARIVVSNQWPCATPSFVTREVLRVCAGANKIDIEDSYPARPYMAENIHPFQVIAQQADVALAGTDDPSFVHFMTYEDLGTHKFKSLYSMTRAGPLTDLEGNKMTFSYSETGEARTDANLGGYRNPFGVMTYSFPCDFDLLSDLLNGIDVDGSDINSLVTINPLTKLASLLGYNAQGCGIGSGVYKTSYTNMNSSMMQMYCPTNVETHLLKRQGRMNLLEKDKVALRITVPWNPMLHVGYVINFELYSKEFPDLKLFGSGEYLISTLQHTIKQGGYSTTIMDCVSVTTGSGLV
jgi:hypothetical protein